MFAWLILLVCKSSAWSTGVRATAQATSLTDRASASRLDARSCDGTGPLGENFSYDDRSEMFNH
jgi:hypothetical protein